MMEDASNQQFFFGKDPRSGRGIYLDGATARNHKAIPAATGAGKGVTIQMLLPQYLLAGDGAFVFDPKRDDKMPRALAHFCLRRGIPFQLIDLRYDQPPQVCLLDGLDAKQIEMVFGAGFDLSDTGEMDRVYRLEDRNAAALAAALAVKHDARALPDLVRLCAAEEEITKAKVFWGFLTELASLPAVSARSGFDLVAPLTQGGMAYIMGDPLDPVIKMAQRMLVVRVLRQIYQRPRSAPNERWVALVLDEFKHLLSPPAIDALGMVRDYRCHAMLLFQSFGDLAGIHGVPESKVRGTVLDNCKLKLVFQAANDDTAQWAANETCTQSAFVGTSDKAHDRERSPGQWRQTEVPSIHPNVFKRLPPLTAAILVGGDARFARIAPLQHLTPTPPPVFATADHGELLSQTSIGSSLI